MDAALCTLDNKEWYADDFFLLSSGNIKVMRRNLKCVICNGDAWFRKASYGNKVPHFCAHHTDDCQLATNYEVIGEGDGGDGQPAADPDSGIILDLGTESNYSVDVIPAEPPMHDATGQKRSGIPMQNAGGINYPAHLTLKNTLYKLVRSDKLYTSDTKVIIPNNQFVGLPEKANELFVKFSDVHKGLKDKNRVFWGFISDAGYTGDGKLWLNVGSRKDGLSVSINPEITDEFRKYFKVEDSLEQFEGCHALIIGNCYYAPSGKPVIWCANLDFIVLRRYNFDSKNN